MSGENESISAKEPGRLQRFALWAAAIIGSSVLTLIVQHNWDAPRAHIELTTLEIGAREVSDGRLDVGADLDNRIRKHRYFRNLGIESTFSEVAEAVADAKEETGLYRRSARHVAELVEFVNTQSTAISLEARRKAFLQKYVGRDLEQNLIEGYLLTVVRDAELPEKYLDHPAGTESLIIPLADSRYNLREIDEVATAQAEAQKNPGDVNAYARALQSAAAVNLWRRILVFYEPDYLALVLNMARDRINDDAQEADDIGGHLEALLASATVQRVTAQVLVSNRGIRPLSLRQLAVVRLLLPVKDGKDSAIVSIPVRFGDKTSTATVIQGGEAEVLSFESIDRVEQIIEQNRDVLGGASWTPGASLDSSRLMLLWRARDSGLRASVHLARAGADPNDALAGRSQFLAVGSSTDDMVIEVLSR